MATFNEKEAFILKSLSKPTQEELYKEIINWGKRLTSFKEEWKNEKNRVSGCQSIMYLYTEFSKDTLFFHAYSDALLSSGLAALLLYLYNGEKCETVLISPPLFFEQCNLTESLTPGRANGFASLYLRMKQEALTCLTSYKTFT